MRVCVWEGEAPRGGCARTHLRSRRPHPVHHLAASRGAATPPRPKNRPPHDGAPPLTRAPTGRGHARSLVLAPGRPPPHCSLRSRSLVWLRVRVSVAQPGRQPARWSLSVSQGHRRTFPLLREVASPPARKQSGLRHFGVRAHRGEAVRRGRSSEAGRR